MKINYNFHHKKISLVDIDPYLDLVGDKNESILHKSVNVHNFHLIKDYCKRNTKVLEIGCGWYSFLKSNCKKQIFYDGLETEHYANKFINKKKIFTLIGTVTNIPNKNEEYDLVLANQSIEHWHEYNDTIKDGLLEINRVLKLNGILAINFPFFLHGHKNFIQGNLDLILSEIDFKYWKLNNIKFYYSSSIPNYKGWKKAGFPNFFVKKIHKSTETSFCVSIDLKKIKSYSIKSSNRKVSKKKISSFKRNIQYGLIVFVYRFLRSIARKFYNN